jgi:hypothetical protein
MKKKIDDIYEKVKIETNNFVDEYDNPIIKRKNGLTQCCTSHSFVNVKKIPVDLKPKFNYQNMRNNINKNYNRLLVTDPDILNPLYQRIPQSKSIWID